MTLKERYEGVINYFKTNVPTAETELNYKNPYELIVAVILSAQCTDVRINKITPKLFKDFPDVETLAASNSDTIFNYIRSVSYPNNKAKHLVGMANMLIKDFNGVVPSEIDQLIKLPGVGRKTANVVASVVYNKPAMAVDTHVFRVSNRLGLTKAKNPLQSEIQLIKHIPKEHVATAHHWLILHGRYTCLARSPKCDICRLTEWCNYYKKSDLNKKEPQLLINKTKIMAKKDITSTKIINKKVITNKITKPIVKKTDSEKKIIIKPQALPAKFIAHSTKLKVGDSAPIFKAKDQHGNIISSNNLLGKTIVLYFYPKDSTPGCTMEACSLRDEHRYFTKQNYIVIGVSADDEIKHKKFADKYDLPFSLLADTEMNIIKKYDVWGTKKFMGKIYDGIIRTTFIIDENGLIKHIITDVKTKEHAQQIINLK